MRLVLVVAALAGLSACQAPDSDEQDTAALNGVWRGVVSDAQQHESLQAHVLDGLMLAVSHDGKRATVVNYALRTGVCKACMPRVTSSARAIAITNCVGRPAAATVLKRTSMASVRMRRLVFSTTQINHTSTRPMRRLQGFITSTVPP